MPAVLVVDDGAANRELIRLYLSSIDCEVRLAADGVTALASLLPSWLLVVGSTLILAIGKYGDVPVSRKFVWKILDRFSRADGVGLPV